MTTTARRKRERRRTVCLWRRLWLSAMVVGCISLLGCESRPDLAPVEGVVTLDGEPVADVGVLFQPKEGPSAFGTTDAKGQFSLSTANRPGAPLGEHVVSITKSEIPNLPRGPDGRVDETKLREMPELSEVNYLPARYSSPTTSELTATVKPDANNFTFSLTTDDTVAPPAESGAEAKPPSD